MVLVWEGSSTFFCSVAHEIVRPKYIGYVRSRLNSPLQESLTDRLSASSWHIDKNIVSLHECLMATTNLIGAHCFVRHRAIESNAAGGGGGGGVTVITWYCTISSTYNVVGLLITKWIYKYLQVLRNNKHY